MERFYVVLAWLNFVVAIGTKIGGRMDLATYVLTGACFFMLVAIRTRQRRT